jgi:predicted metal-dependent hydrolase
MQKSRWGSCSRKKNLNFNYKLIQLPLELADYIVVHELCHLQEFNHGQGFWNLVGETIPDYKARRDELRKKFIHVS